MIQERAPDSAGVCDWSELMAHIYSEPPYTYYGHDPVAEALHMKILVNDLSKHVGQQSFNDITSHEDSTVYTSVALIGDLLLPDGSGARGQCEQALLAAVLRKVL